MIFFVFAFGCATRLVRSIRPTAMGSKGAPHPVSELGLKGQEAAGPSYFLNSYKKRSMGFSPCW